MTTLKNFLALLLIVLAMASQGADAGRGGGGKKGDFSVRGGSKKGKKMLQKLMARRRPKKEEQPDVGSGGEEGGVPVKGDRSTATRSTSGVFPFEPTFECEVTTLQDNVPGQSIIPFSLRDCVDQFSTLIPIDGSVPIFKIFFSRALLTEGGYEGGFVILQETLFVTSPVSGSAMLIAAPDLGGGATITITLIEDPLPDSFIENVINVDNGISFGIQNIKVFGGTVDTIAMFGDDPLDEAFFNDFFTCEDSTVAEGGRRGVALLDVAAFVIRNCIFWRNFEDGFRYDLDLNVGETAVRDWVGTVTNSEFIDNGRDGFHIDEGPGICFIDRSYLNRNGRDGLYIADQTRPGFASINLEARSCELDFNGSRDGANLAEANVIFDRCSISDNFENGVATALFSHISLYGTTVYDNGQAGVNMSVEFGGEVLSVSDIARFADIAGNPLGAVVASGPRLP